MLIDTHCHLDFPDLVARLPEVIGRARQAGVDQLITISTRVRQVGRYAEIAEAHPQVLFTVGTHPHNAAEEPDVTAQDLLTAAEHPRCVAIGESGLDFHYDRSPRDVQERGFRTHIAAARASGLPLVIHAREADEAMIQILREEHGRGRFDAILHCFSSGEELAAAGVELGFYVSFSGILTFKGSSDLRRIAAEVVPADRLLLETDAPYLAPVPYRGKVNEPAYVVETARVLAATVGVSEQEIARITTANALRIFGKARPFAAATPNTQAA